MSQFTMTARESFTFLGRDKSKNMPILTLPCDMPSPFSVAGLVARTLQKRLRVPLYKGTKTDAKAAGYMELAGAVKDADCKIVRVSRGVSSDKGCCNLFDPKKNVTKFSCGTCSYLVKSGT